MLQKFSAVLCFVFLTLGSFVFGQEIPCVTSGTYYAFSGGKGLPLKYNIVDGFIEVKEMRKDKDELLTTYKISKVVKCNYRNPSNSNLIFKINSYDKVSDTYGDKESEIEINIMEGKGKIFVRQPGLPEIANRASSMAPRR
ncbi:hypothetical protein [Chryseobacterium sp. JUb7]|uniref:hypothetical protein n=1 Tax=Chryseobacterium sp. JUb7 TaxID=2940599 RepID=UPI0021680E39|nr:hypothetical protein [Chryseobacterium sp. JUb7]MCS3529607.1 hypothetical protein [Chryseobacterium sp. JUb7]